MEKCGRHSRRPVPAPSDDAVEKPKIGFDDVGGMDAVKDEIRMKIIHPLTHADLYKAYGKTIGGGILMYGPPGLRQDAPRPRDGRRDQGGVHRRSASTTCWTCGSATASGTCTRCSSRPAGTGRACCSSTRSTPWPPAGATCGTAAARHLINQFLSEMDGVQASNDGVLILAATNAPWHVDPRLPPAGPVRPHPVRPAAGRAGAGGDPAASCCKGKPQERSTSTMSRRRPTDSAAPT